MPAVYRIMLEIRFKYPAIFLYLPRSVFVLLWMKGFLQVSVAVLLDNFVQASADMEQEEDNRRRINALKFGPVRRKR